MKNLYHHKTIHALGIAFFLCLTTFSTHANAQVICDNSTCITQKTVDTAKHKEVQRDDAQSYSERIEVPKEGECPAPAKTGATAQRQGNRTLEEYADGFCINQGCSFKKNGEEGACE